MWGAGVDRGGRASSWSGAPRPVSMSVRTDRKKPSAWRSGSRKINLIAMAVSIARSENRRGAPGRFDGSGRHASIASGDSQKVRSPR